MTMEEQERCILDGRQKFLRRLQKQRTENRFGMGWMSVYTQTCLDLLHRSCKSTVEKMNSLD